MWTTPPSDDDVLSAAKGLDARQPGSPAAVSPLFTRCCELPGHVFSPDTISLRDHAGVEASRLLDSAQLTDTYVLALDNHGRLASLDRRSATQAVRGGRQTLLLIDRAPGRNPTVR